MKLYDEETIKAYDEVIDKQSKLLEAVKAGKVDKDVSKQEAEFLELELADKMAFISSRKPVVVDDKLELVEKDDELLLSVKKEPVVEKEPLVKR
jgi:hypothetical protein